MPIDFAYPDLPNKRTGSLSHKLNEFSLLKILVYGIIGYVLVVALITSLEIASKHFGVNLVSHSDRNPITSNWDIFYYNFITILTVGYGDLIPVGYGKFLSIVEAFIGIGLFSCLVSIITLKAIFPPRNSVVFSKNAYYCLDPSCFLIIYLNTSFEYIEMFKMSSYFKLGGDWSVRHEITSPFITMAVQTFYIEFESEYQDIDNIINSLKDRDCLRIGVSGNIGFSVYSTSRQYSVDEILVINNRNELINYEGFWDPNLENEEFNQMFHYHPQGALTIRKYVEKAKINRGQNEKDNHI